MNKIAYVIILICISINYSFGQIGIGTKTPNISSILEINSTTLGFLPPRMTKSQRDAIVAPAVGLFVYNTDSKCYQFYNGGSWSNCLRETPVNKLDCSSININGAYITTQPLNNTNTITIDVLVGAYDIYSISTNTVNGYSFSASGVFFSLGLNTITLTGSGTPLVAQTDTFTMVFTGTDFVCSANVTPIN